MKKLTVEDLENIEKTLNIDQKDPYIFSYRYLIQFFRQIKSFSSSDAVICASLVYSWMPTILNLKDDLINKIPPLLNNAKNCQELSKIDLNVLKTFVNNSIVGASKLLHFISPDYYPIWDRKICNFLLGKSYSYIVNNISNYLGYVDFCRSFSTLDLFNPIYFSLQKKVGYKFTRLRAIELILFYASKK